LKIFVWIFIEVRQPTGKPITNFIVELI